MIELLVISSILLFFGLPFVLVLSACIAGTRADRKAQSATSTESHISRARFMHDTLSS